MNERKSTDQLEVGEEMEPLEIIVTREFNQQYLDALDDHHPRYMNDTEDQPPIVHPGLLVNYSNRTRSPSYYLELGVATVHAKEKVVFLHPARVGKRLTITWKVSEKYEKRGRIYSIMDVLIHDEDGHDIFKRELTSIFMRR